MKKMRIQTGLEQLLMKMFDQPNARLERHVIQSSQFRKSVLSTWADWSIQENRLVDSQGIPKLPQLCAIKASQQTPQITWMLDRITKGPKDLDCSFSAFPSTLSRTGPQYPFTYSEFDHLRKRAGEVKGTEMTRPIKVLPRPVSRGLKKKQRSEDLAVYKWSVADDDDRFEEDPLNLKSTRFYPNSY